MKKVYIILISVLVFPFLFIACKQTDAPEINSKKTGSEISPPVEFGNNNDQGEDNDDQGEFGNNDDQGENNDDQGGKIKQLKDIETQKELPAVFFKNIEEANLYLIENNININYNEVLNDFYNAARMRTSATCAFYADLDNDGTYEVYMNQFLGSGIVHEYIHGYNPVNGEYYRLYNRMVTDYIFFIYKEKLFVLTSNHWYSKKSPEYKVYNPVLMDGELNLEEIENELHNEIMNLLIIENITRSWWWFAGLEIFRDNN